MTESTARPQASSVLEYKCPCCGAGLAFASVEQKLKCDSCGNTFDPKTVESYNAAISEPEESIQWESYGSDSGSGNWRTGEAEKMQVFTCPSCGGEILTDANTAATFCPYCENPAIISSRVNAEFRPDFVIPFQTDKEAAKAAMKKLCKGKVLLPKNFASEHRLEMISGMYVPFWIYSCGAEAKTRYRARRIHTWADSQYNYTRTDHFLLYRAANLQFDGVPVDGSKKMDDSYMESLEPFDYSKAVDFNTAYLSGFLADKYDVTAEQGQSRANSRIEKTAESLLLGTTGGYLSVLPEGKSVRLSSGSIRYGLLPVWMLNTKYKDEIYTFAMNGQTGKIVGKLPVSKGRCFGLFAGVSAALSLLFMLFSLLI